MNITQLKYVLAIASSASMREAATGLYVSQPALSASVRELEEELGLLLFARTNKGILLTDEGREFVNYAKRVVGQYDILEERYLQKDGNRERFSVSAQHFNFAIHAFAEVVQRFSPEEYAFSIHETKTREVLDDVRSMKSEVGVISFSGDGEDVMKKLFREYQLSFTPLMKREAYAYVWEDHPFAGRETVSLAELGDYPFVAFDQSDDSNFYLTEEALADYEFKKQIRSHDRATSMELIASLHGFSIGTGTLSGEDAILKGLVSIRLTEEDPIIIGYITRTGSLMSEYGEAYVEALGKYREL